MADGAFAQHEADMIQAAAGISQADNIKVAVRARPVSDKESAAGKKEAIVVAPDGTNVEVLASDGKAHKLRFHCCMGPATTQPEVVDGCGATQLMQAALHGYHTTVFAYGQTGSGKTYTMFGREDNLASAGYTGDDHDGLVLRSMRFLYEQVENSPHEQVRVKASCLEVYNENVYDLLNITNKPLPLKWEAERGFWVPDLRIVDCSTYAKFAHVAHVGMKNRKTGSHALNHESSRSHAILTVNLEITNVDAGSPEYGQVRFGKISFVDLAGSERVKETGAAGKTLNEANSINRSLHMLGKVISTLSEAGDQANVHVPYRDSKLTKLLMDSIGGNALCLMIACIGPTDAHTEETLNTLQYATRAKNIRNRPRVQYKEDRHLIASLRQELELLRNENHYLRSFLVPLSECNGFGCSYGTDEPKSSGEKQQERPALPASTQASTPSRAPNVQEAGVSGRSLTSSPPARQQGQAAAPAPARVPQRDSGLNTPGKSPERKLAPLEIPARSGDSITSQTESVLSARPGSKPQTANADSTKRLQQTQFSEANTKLAEENDRLRRGRQTLAKDHADVLNEIEVLRSRLTAIEGNYVATTPLGGSRAGSALGSHSNWSSPKSSGSRGGPGGGLWEGPSLRPSASPSPARKLGEGRCAPFTELCECL